MRAFTFFGALPALVDRAIGSQRSWRGLVAGSAAGLAAAFAYDLFRLFEFSRPSQPNRQEGRRG